ncbi:CoA ester lyase [Nocardia cyriacigeorgica]|nr:CoA ester lyase [Nocardia cyriacigeorgica]
MTDQVSTAATLLFVPADRPERFAKAAAAGADLVVLDLEDAVAPENKASARRHAADWVAAGHRCAVRVNAAGTPWHDAELAVLAPARCAVMLPKAEDPAIVRRVAQVLGPDVPLIALIETARGVLEAARIAAVARVRRLALGTFDLAAELGIDPADRAALSATRQQLVLAAAAAGLPGPIDGVTAAIDDAERLTDDTRYGARLGFAGKLCIHPRQLAPVAAALRPSERELIWAVRVIDAVEAGSGVAVVDGTMVDKPVVDRAQRILARAGTLPNTDNCEDNP